MADEYRRFWITSSLETERERLLAEAFEAGAEGAEETQDRGNYRACIYAPAARVETIREILSDLASGNAQIHDSEAIPNVDWSEAWKDGLEALRISSRLVVRPPFIEVELESGQQEVVIDPGQAFGTGGHASTRLCLEWIDDLYAEPDGRARFDRVLDAGTGSGVLAFAALKLGARSAVGFDLDEVAIDAARVSARDNRLSEQIELLAAPIDDLPDPSVRFPLVVANLLKREVLPIASQLVARLQAGGRLVLAGLLEEDGPEVLGRFAREGLVEAADRRTIDDSTGTWIGLCLERESSRP
jgi:ribosomal protein L11 methyltransferase